MANCIKNKTIGELKELRKERNGSYSYGINIEENSFIHRFNLYSVIWAIPSMIAVIYLFNLFLTQTKLEWESESTHAIVILWFIFASYFCIRTISVFNIVTTGLSSYSQARKLPIARMSYRYIKEMMKYMYDDFHIEYITVEDKKNFDNLSRYAIIYKDEEICGSWFCYIVLTCGYYVYKLTNKFERRLKLFGITYFANKEEKKKFNTEVNAHTQKVVKMMLKSVENMQKESAEYYKKAQEELNK